MRKGKNLNIWLAMSMFLLLMVSTTAGEIIFVDKDASGANNGSSWADAFNELQDALAVALSGDEIRVAQGTYKPDEGGGITAGDRTATFQLVNGVTIKGGYAGFGEPDPNARDVHAYETILSGDLTSNDVDVNDPADLLDEPTRAENSYHVVTGSGTDANAILDGFTITGGNANVRIQHDRGGGMYNESGSPTLTNCTFAANSAIVGGGMSNGSGSPRLTNCTFAANWAIYGGGMRNGSGSPKLTKCTFIGNTSKWLGGGGGGIYNADSISLMSCIFIGNTAQCGGGMYNEYYFSSAVLINCIFVGNSVNAWGGGIYNYLSDLTLANCMFFGNSAGDKGGGLYIPPPPAPFVSSSSTAYYGYSIITNCIFWDNLPEQIVNRGGDISVVYSDIQGSWPGFGNIDDDPCFADPCNDDYHLLEDSPCIDAGDPNYTAEPNETDLDGKPRVIGGRIDIGAYEYSPPIPAEVRIVPRTINLASKGKWITCYICLPEDCDVADIDPNSVVLEDEIRAASLVVDEQQQVAVVRFSREQAQAILEAGQAELTISGQLTNGTVFEGTDVIKVANKSSGKHDKYVQASDPNPTDGATSVSIYTDLSWTASPSATSHDVYFGTGSLPPFVCNQIATAFDPGRMNSGRTYYWRIDEVNKWGKTTGQLWSFTTIEGPVPPPPP